LFAWTITSAERLHAVAPSVEVPETLIVYPVLMGRRLAMRKVAGLPDTETVPFWTGGVNTHVNVFSCSLMGSAQLAVTFADPIGAAGAASIPASEPPSEPLSANEALPTIEEESGDSVLEEHPIGLAAVAAAPAAHAINTLRKNDVWTFDRMISPERVLHARERRSLGVQESARSASCHFPVLFRQVAP
jgi:hypothetical protein